MKRIFMFIITRDMNRAARTLKNQDYVILYKLCELEIISKYGDNVFAIRIIKFISKDQITKLGI